MATEIAQRNEQGIAPVIEPSNLLQVLERAASNPDVDVEKMERLMAMHERMVGKQSEQAFNEAMTAAQSEMGRVSADAKNNQTHSAYVTYGKLDKVLRPIYTRHGFALSFGTGEAPQPEYVRILCNVSHKAGHSRTYQVDMPADGKGAKGGDVMTKTHAAGSAMSYGMRYLLKLIFNVAVGEEDDDGNGASLEPITSKQHDALMAQIESSGADLPKFLTYFGIEELRELPASRFTEAAAALTMKGAQKNA